MIGFDCEVEFPFLDCCNDCEDCLYFNRLDLCGSDSFHLPISAL